MGWDAGKVSVTRIVVACLLFSGLWHGARAQQAPAGKPCILFLSGRVVQNAPGNPSKYRLRTCLPAARLQDKMQEWGYVWATDFFCTEMTWEYLKQFNAVVALDFPNIERYRDATDGIRHVEALLRRFADEGGGLLLTTTTESSQWGMERNVEEMNRFLEYFGGKVGLEQVTEENPMLRLPKPNPRTSISTLAWTGNVVQHSLTEGVRGLIYPNDHGSMCYYTHPVVVGPPWDVILKASPTARTVTVRLGTSVVNKSTQPGSIESEPDLIAVREAGKGRVALWPTVPTATIIDGYHEFWGSGIIMDGGDEQHPSDAERLLKNLFAWLTESSRGSFGGYVAPPKEEEEELGLHAINWDGLGFPKQSFPNTHKGLIGLRSVYSSGTNSATEMISAAKYAGYDFAAFSESLEDLEEKELGELIETCRAHSSPEFQVFAGYVYHDASGNAWQVFGTDPHWPKDAWWHDREKKTIDNNNVIFRGYQFFPVIMLHPNRNPEKPCFQGNFKGMAVHTYENGALVDDGTLVYRNLQSNNFRLFPVVVHLVDSVGGVAKAALPEFPQTYAPWYELSDVLSAYTGTIPKYQGRAVHKWPQYISSGPAIDVWRVVNFGTSDLAIEGNDRYRMQIKLRSDAGLREVKIVDKGRVWRRFILNGEKDWSIEQDGFHDEVHEFLMIVTDVNGGTAQSSVIGTGVQEIALVRCTDNLNTFTSGKFKAESVFPIRGLENYIERQSGTLSYFPRIPGPEFTERPAVEQEITHCSRFGFVRTDTFDHFYPKDATSNWNKTDVPFLAKPAWHLKGQARVTCFTPWADGTSVYLVDGSMEAAQDMEIPRKEISVFQSLWIEDSATVMVRRKAGPPLCVVLRPRRSSIVGDCSDVLYAANLGSFSGARGFVPLSENLIYKGIQQGSAEARRTTILGYYRLAGATLKAGTKMPYRYLAVWSEVKDRADTSFIDDLCEKMGVGGSVPAYTVLPRHGRVVSTSFSLNLQAQDYAFSGSLSEADLPLHLPVLIDGLNPNWPGGIWYKGRQRFVRPEWAMDRVHNRFSKRVKVAAQDLIVRFGIDGTTGICQVDTTFGEKDVFIGNLLTCNKSELILELEDTRAGKRRIAVNNPTDQPMEANIAPAPGFELLGKFSIPVSLKAGEYKILSDF